MTIPFLKPSDLKPAPADGKLVRDANALEWLSKAEFLIEEAKCSLQHDAAACRQLLGGASTALDRAIGATTDDAAISAIFTEAVKAEEAITADTVRTAALKTLHDLMTGEYVSHAIRADVAKYIIESRIG